MAAPMSDAISPLAMPFPALPAIAGVTARIARAGYKDWGRCDLTYVELSEGTEVAGVFTRNVCCSSEVELGREQVKAGRARALVVNAGNSNAFTGYRGREAVEQIMAQVAGHLGCAPAEVFVSSTGVIGVPLPKDKAREGVASGDGRGPMFVGRGGADDQHHRHLSPRRGTATAMVGDTTVTLGGDHQGQRHDRARHGDDAGLHLHRLRRRAGRSCRTCWPGPPTRGFNCITVDSDTSTSDTVLAFATGTGGERCGSKAIDSPGADAFAAALSDVCLRNSPIWSCATARARTKFVEIRVTGAASDASARRIGLSVANSPLVKTAIAGEDANWGRVVMAVGKAGEPADRDRLAIRFGDIWLARDGLGGGRLRRSAGRRAPQGPRHPHRHRSWAGQRRGDGVDLRSHPWIHLDQRGLS